MTFAAGDVRETISLKTLDDDADEPDETVSVTLSPPGPAQATLGTSSSAAGTIVDSDLPTVTVAAQADTVEEGKHAAIFRLTRAGHLSEELTVPFVVTGGDAVLTDAPPTETTFAADKAVTEVSLAIDDDGTDEEDAALTLALAGGADHDLGEPSTSTVTVVDNDLLLVTVVADAAAVTEGEDAVFTLTRAGVLSGELKVTVAVTDPAAVLADAAPTSVSFGPGDATAELRLRTADDTVDEEDATLTLTPGESAAYDLGDPSTAAVTVRDDDLPRVTVVADAAAVMEGEDAVFTLTREGVVSERLKVAYAFRIGRDGVSGRSREGGAFRRTGDEQSAATVTFEAGRTTVQVRRTTPDDNIDRSDRTFFLWLVSGADDRLGNPSRAMMAVQDNDGVPKVTIADAPTVPEGGTLAFPVRLSRPSDRRITVAYTLAGSATQDDDYTDGGGGTVTFPAGETERTISLATVDDRDNEPEETVEVSLTAPDPALATLGAPSEATGRIEGDEGVSAVTVTADADAVTEGEDAVFTLTRVGDVSGPLAVLMTVTDADGVLASTAPTSARFGAGDATVTLRLGTLDDVISEATAELVLALRPDAAYALGVPSEATVAVRDNDRPVVTVAADAAAVTEGEDAVFSLIRVGDLSAVLTVSVRVTDAGSVLKDTPPASVSFAAENATAVLRLGTDDDETDEPDTTVTVILAAGDDHDLGTPSSAGVTVRDGDATPMVTLVLTPSLIGESGEASTVTANLDRPSSADTTVTVSVTPVASAVATDYTPSSNLTLTIPSGAMESEGVVTITATGDDEHAPDKIVTVSAMATNAQGVTAPQAVTLTIEDDDDSPATGAVTVTGTATEGETLTADMSGIVDGDGLDNAAYAYQWTRMPSGGGDADIAGATGATYVPVFADVGATLRVRVTVTDDEGHEATFTSAPTSVVAALPRPDVTVASGGDVTEGSAAVFMLTRTGDTAATLEVAWETTASGDFGAATGAGTATFPVDGATVQVSVATTDDGVHETHGSVTLSLTADTGADPAWLPGDPATATVAVKDDDNAAPTGAPLIDDMTPVVGQTLTADPSGIDDPDGLTGTSWAWRWLRVSSGGTETQVSTGASYMVIAGDVGATLKVEASFVDDDGTEEMVESVETAAVEAATRPRVAVARVSGAVEEGKAAQFKLTRTGVTTGVLTVVYDISESGDMVAPDEEGAKSVAFGDRVTGVTVMVPTVEDAVHEADSAVTLTLTADAAWDLGTANGQVTVEDDDAPTVAIGTPVAAVAEGGTLRFPVTLDRAAYLDIRFDYAVTGGTAGAGDHADTGGGTLTVPAGDTTAYIDLDVVDDSVDEPDEETVEVTISDIRPAGAATPGTVTATGTITDDDAAPTVTLILTPSSIDESGETSTVTASLDRPSSEDTTVTVSVTPVAPAAATDYTPSSNLTLTIPSGATESEGVVTITATGDDEHAPDKIVTVSATATNAQGITAPQAVTLTIEDDDDSPATGAVTVTGAATEGETLTADTSGITDGDGLDNARYVYQWTRTPAAGSDVDISDATSQTYVPVFADAGATLKVRVTVTDDEGHEATFTSAPTSAVAALPRPDVTVASDGDVTEGNAAAFTLTRTGDTAAMLDVAWTVTAAGDFGAATGAGTVTFPVDGATVQVSVATTDDGIHETHGSVTLSLTADMSADPAWLPGDPATATVAVKDDDNAAPTGAPSIDDTTPVVGQTLTADPSGIDDPDGLTGASWAWRWLRVAPGGAETEVGTGVSYTVVAGDVGATLKTEASFTDDGGTEETVESAETAAVEAAPRPRVAVAPVASPVEEGEAARFTLTRTGVMADALMVRYAVSESGDMVAPGDEGAKSVAFGDGVAGVTVTVPTVEDAVHEADSAVTLTLTADAAPGTWGPPAGR